MAVENYSHEEYLEAFEKFMQTGKNTTLAPYLDGDRPASFLSVYRNGFIRASVSALESNFPSLVKLWGADYFGQLASTYVKATPPPSATLIGYGFTGILGVSTPSFVDFLQKDVPDLVTRYPYSLDLCHLDQAWLQALNENGEVFLSLETVQGIIERGEDLAELSIGLTDSAQIIDLKFEIFELWGQLRFGDMDENQKIALKTRPNSVIFWQLDLQVQAKPMSVVETIFMKSLKKTASFDVATSEAVSLDENFDVSTLFAELLNAHLLK